MIQVSHKVTVVFIHTMEDDQRLNTLVHEGDTHGFPLSIARRQKITKHTHTSAHMIDNDEHTSYKYHYYSDIATILHYGGPYELSIV